VTLLVPPKKLLRTLGTLEALKSLKIVDVGAEITPDIKHQVVAESGLGYSTVRRHLRLLEKAGFLKTKFGPGHVKIYRLQYPLDYVTAKLQEIAKKIEPEKFFEKKSQIVVSKPLPIEVLSSTRGCDSEYRPYGQQLRQIWKRICEQIPVGFAQQVSVRRGAVMFHLRKLFQDSELPKKNFIVIERGPDENRKTYVVHLSSDPAERKEQLERLGFIPSRRWMSPTKPLIQPGGRRWIELCLSMKKGETKKLEMKWPSVARNRIKNLIKRGLLPDEFEVRTSGQIVYITRKEK